MSSLIWYIVIVVIVLSLVGLFMTARQRRHSLQERFGPEYDRSVETAGGRRQAERELRDKAARRDQLDIRPLSAESHERYADEWALVQEGFVDAPRDAVDQADELVVRVMLERGYPVDDFETRSDMAAVDHPDVVTHYRAAHQIRTANRTGDADTEQLRVAVVHYRWLFDALLGERESATSNSNEHAATANDHRATADDQRATADDQRATADDQRATVDDQRATVDDGQRATADDQRATADDQHIR